MIKIIPAIDIIEGKCVRLTMGDFTTKKIYDENPLEVAKKFEGNGVVYLHLVDLDGAKAKRIVNRKTLETISAGTNLKIDFGGGVGDEENLRIAFQCGASKITVGSLAVAEKETVTSWLNRFGEKIILGADAKNGMIAVNAWRLTTNRSAINFIKDYHIRGAKSVIVTDISRDGSLSGPAFNLYEEIKNEIPEIELIASGGVSKIEDVDRLNELNIDGVIIGKAIYEGKIELKELEKYLC
ncbi:MAG: 1-(5-phosphoribosyl)-5-[(5-phosphoribosylamino)methylideneamino]imidazole-4-carboxamide isomerase [Chlorobi bacterium]|nr:1-(5-phosphoribosyl)-5-[(5-phosphoribosylamino)methylideneamino]imidazole-4-carboxamide isomerase [Chlorobiota bacterium]